MTVSKNETRPMRSKEFANDYRYFPDPDLLPVMISDAEIEEIKATFPEMPKDKFVRYQSEFKIPENDAQIISCLLYTSPSPRDATLSRMPSSA